MLKRVRPKSVWDLPKRTKYLHVGEGCFRNAYHLGHGIIIKFPKSPGTRYHARREIDRIQKIFRFKKYKALRAFIPKIYYMDRHNGVIAMEKLKKGVSQDACQILNRLFNSMWRYSGNDLHTANIGRDGYGNVKCFDLGL